MTAQLMRQDDPMRRSGAVWCDLPGHGRWECAGDSKRSKVRCHQPAITGTDRCRMHAGEKASVARAKGDANMAAWSLEVAAELPPLHPHDRMLALIQLTSYRHAVYAEELRQLYVAEGAGALVGSTWTAGRGGESVQTGEQIRGLTKLEGDERDKLARYLKAAHDMGIATQVIELAQGQAEIVVLAFRAALEAAGASLLPADRAVMVETFLHRLGGRDVVVGELVASEGTGS